MGHPLSDEALDTLFREARTHSHWEPRPVEEATLRELYDLVKFAPTSANTAPMRVIFVKSKEAKERLLPALSPGNVEKTMSAPVTAIIADDLRFHVHLPRLFPQAPGFVDYFTKPGQEAFTREHAFRNATLQGAYLILAARALGLDAGPMSGFDSAKVDAAFFPEGTVKSNFLVNLGYGDGSKLHPRNPRLEFGEVVKVL